MKEQIKQNLVMQHERLKRSAKTLLERISYLRVKTDKGQSSYSLAEISALTLAIELISEEHERVRIQISRIRDIETGTNGVGEYN